MDKGFLYIFLIILTVLLLIPVQGYARKIDFGFYELILERYLREGRTIEGIKLNVVDYEGLYKEYKDPFSNYSRFIKKLSRFNPKDLHTRDEKIAFWINAYNIGAIKLILDHYPVDSIRSTKINFFKNPWKIKVLNVNGKEYSLYEIEHNILLGKYREKIAHFGIVCASLSCPDLSKEVYKGKTLKEQLDRQARLFFKSKSKGIFIDRSKNIVYVSKIFKFDSKNFSRGKEDIIPFIISFIDNKEDREYLKIKNYKLKFLDYNWNLNSLKSVKGSE